MGNQVANLTQDNLNKLSKETESKSQLLIQVKQKEIKKIHKKFMNLDKEKKGHVTTKDVLTIPEIVKNPMREYITQFMMNQNNSNVDEVDFEKFLKLIDIFKNNKLDEQYKFIFDLFDYNKDGKICNEDFLVNMKLFLGDSMNEEQISEIVEKTLLEYSNNQKYITFNEFVKILES